MPNNFFGDAYQTNMAEENLVLPQAREPKRRFVPSKWEAKAVLRIIRSLRKNPDARARKDARESNDAPKLLWEGDEDPATKHNGLAYLPAPRAKLPTHGDSYNPPFEYRADAQVDEKGDEVSAPRRFYDALRRVPSYAPFVLERFQRCLDLYLCPRVSKTRLNINPKDMLPPLPSPKELRPYPNARCLRTSATATRWSRSPSTPAGSGCCPGRWTRPCACGRCPPRDACACGRSRTPC